jgi:hypothetical protein
VVGDIVFEGGQAASDDSTRSVLLVARPVDLAGAAVIAPGAAVRANPDGTFELRNLWGRCVINVGAPPGWAQKAVRAGGTDMTDRPIDFDRDPGRLQVVLTNQLTEISGTVEDQDHPSSSSQLTRAAGTSSRDTFDSCEPTRTVTSSSRACRRRTITSWPSAA